MGIIYDRFIVQASLTIVIYNHNMLIVQATSLNYLCFLSVFQESSILSKFHFFLPKDKRLLVGAATLSITTFSITTRSIKGSYARIRLNETEHD
jgi:hypothetical protein